MSFCPFQTDKCGANKEKTFADETAPPETISSTDMVDGEVCSYQIKADCGAIGVEETDASTATNVETTVICSNLDFSET